MRAAPCANSTRQTAMGGRSSVLIGPRLIQKYRMVPHSANYGIDKPERVKRLSSDLGAHLT
eukprot:5765733-Pleurochrysis_carterae.AAC.2